MSYGSANNVIYMSASPTELWAPWVSLLDSLPCAGVAHRACSVVIWIEVIPEEETFPLGLSFRLFYLRLDEWYEHFFPSKGARSYGAVMATVFASLSSTYSRN